MQDNLKKYLTDALRKCEQKLQVEDGRSRREEHFGPFLTGPCASGPAFTDPPESSDQFPLSVHSFASGDLEMMCVLLHLLGIRRLEMYSGSGSCYDIYAMCFYMVCTDVCS